VGSDTADVVRGMRIEQGAKRVRAYLAGQLVVDSSQPVLVWESPHYPTYYFPASDVRAHLEEEGEIAHSTSRGDGVRYAVLVTDARAPSGALRYATSPIERLRDLVRLEWDAMDAWFEEDEQIFTHVRNPFTRVDILPSSRHVRVEVEGVTVAESASPHLLFETGLPVRYYLPRPHVRIDLLELDELVTHCPYKGTAQSWSLRLEGTLRENIAWSYPTPLPESERIAGLVAFYDGKVDLYVDGVAQGA
jgi:uncharacterized protein (DUF427 family)